MNHGKEKPYCKPVNIGQQISLRQKKTQHWKPVVSSTTWGAESGLP
jgi:hypothetical protein